MNLYRLTKPAISPVDLEEIKEFLRIDEDWDDAILMTLVTASCSYLDGPHGLLGRCLISQSWRLELPAFPREIALPLPPCQRVEAIVYADAAGVDQTLAPDLYRLDGRDPAIVRPVTSWPAGHKVRIDFTAGYGDSPDDVPEDLRQAIRMITGHFFANRELSLPTDERISSQSFGLSDLIASYRQWEF